MIRPPAPASALAEGIDALLEVSVVGSFSRIGYVTRRRLFSWEDPRPEALLGRVALVTGASSGLGFATARNLAALGATVVLLGRDHTRTEEARTAIEAAVDGADVSVVLADLDRLDEVRRAAAEVLRDHDRLDILVHNAGTLTHELVHTPDGIEQTTQTHVVAPFLLTALLLPSLRVAGGRVITVTSGGMYTARLDLDALTAPDAATFDGVRAYARAKRAQVVLTEQWAERFAGSGVTFVAMHPGWADTPGVRTALPSFHRLVGPILRTPDEGVDTTVWLASTDLPEDANGALFLDRHRRRTVHVPGTATSDADAQLLWDWCAARAGVDHLEPNRILERNGTTSSLTEARRP